jgi:hypothetical protein
MGEVALARLWRLPDGTTCLILKDPEADAWIVRVVRGDIVLRSDQFSHAIVAMEQARQWRTSFDPDFQSSL